MGRSAQLRLGIGKRGEGALGPIFQISNVLIRRIGWRLEPRENRARIAPERRDDRFICSWFSTEQPVGCPGLQIESIQKWTVAVRRSTETVEVDRGPCLDDRSV